MIETELKFQIPKKKIENFLNLLRKKGYKVVSKRTYEKTVMYDNAQRIMQKTDGRVRLRVNNQKCELSYKKPLTRKGIKKEREDEVVVSDFKITEKILAMIGFRPVSSYERYRTKFEKDRVEVTIDEYPFASFVEIEGEEEEIKKLAVALGFSLKDNLTESCDTLFQRWRKKKGLAFKPHMRFEDYAN